MNTTFFITAVSSFTLLFVPSLAFAHTTVDVEQFEIEVGWEIEPSVVGYRNAFIFEINEPGDNPGVKTGVKKI